MPPRLLDVGTPSRPDAAVVVLHGGAARREGPAVSPTQLSVLRMVPVAHRLARAGRGRLAVVRLLNTYRGWDASSTPVEDATWALGQLRERYDGIPLGLVGHSLGGRAAILAGDRPGVRSVVALNPWVYPSDQVDLTGRQVLIVHGTDDRIALPERSERVADTLRRTAEVEYRTIPGGKHAMLSHARAFEKAAASFTVTVLLNGA